MKKVFILLIVLFFGACVTLAANTDWDCSVVFSQEKLLLNWGEDIEDPIAKIMPKEAMEKVFDNLKSYCCDTKKLDTGSCVSKNSDVFYPESIYFFDHVFDVYLRRLDAKEENDNWENLLYWLEPDWSGKERREFIIKHGNDVNWSLPLEILQKYNSFWSGAQTIPVYSEMDWVKQDVWEKETESAINDYDIWTLYDKYNLACDVSKYITEYVMKSANLSKLTTEEYSQCKNLTNKRINNEKIYAQIVLMQKWDKMLSENMDAYMDTYFVNNKLSNLLQEIFNISTSFSEVTRAVSRLVNHCN